MPIYKVKNINGWSTLYTILIFLSNHQKIWYRIENKIIAIVQIMFSYTCVYSVFCKEFFMQQSILYIVNEYSFVKYHSHLLLMD